MRTDLRFAKTALGAVLLAGLLGGCDGSSAEVGQGQVPRGRLRLEQMNYGRLVDVYAYRIIDTGRSVDRRNRFNREAVLIERNVVIDPNIETQPLFDPAGREQLDTDYEFRTFDIATGHDELVILWDDREGFGESSRFEQALTDATSNLLEISPAFRDQNTAVRPIPVVPRNAAIRLDFSGRLEVGTEFFVVNPSAVQLLEFRADPSTASPGEAFVALTYRPIVSGNSLILDTSILGGEGSSGVSVSGLPPSVDNVTANIRVAIPSRGQVSSSFFVEEDPVNELNGPDSFGRDSVIRDFRSGNESDGRAAALADGENPMIIGDLDMGIIAIDRQERVLTINKRFHQVVVRARFPFVEGSIDSGSNLPRGPSGVPTVRPLRSGDFLFQDVDVQHPDGSVETVRLKAEILQNMDVGTFEGDPAFPAIGLAANGSQGASATTVRVKVASLEGRDSRGNPVSFVASNLPLGQDCTVRIHYYEEVDFIAGGNVVSDRNRRNEFLVLEPRPPTLDPNRNPIPPATQVDPMASLALRFSEPMDLTRIDPQRNLVISNSTMNGADFATLIDEPKPSSLSIWTARLSDQQRDGTVLQLVAPLGHFHEQGQTEQYWFHVLLGETGVTDLAGNQIEVFDDEVNPAPNWSVDYTLADTAADNLIGSRQYRFEAVDEDGTPPGSVDVFGQFRMRNGRLAASDTIRFSRTADSQNLGGIPRVGRGECFDPVGQPGAMPPVPPGNLPPLPIPNFVTGFLYLQPRMFDTVLPPNVPSSFLPPNTPQPVGRIVEPHQPRGSRMMMRYIEDDFSLDYKQSNEFLLDIEQLYWSPFNDETVLFDQFDRYTMALSHCDRRPDIRFWVDPMGTPGMPPTAGCLMLCSSMNSGLSNTFATNILTGTSQVRVFEDKVYRIDPNSAFRSPGNIQYVPYPEFDRSYTWRDYRLITVDSNGEVVGLGGARDPTGTPPAVDTTVNIDSPWIEDNPPPEHAGNLWVMDEADFNGDRRRDHNPIALPLLVDFLVFPDDPANGVASGANAFQIAMIGPPSAFPLLNPGGYYNSVGAGCAGFPPWPATRIHSTGGLDPNTNQDILVDPSMVTVAQGGWVKDAGAIILGGDRTTGIFRAPAADSHLHWAQADFVRKVSAVTFGFFDTLKPNQHLLDSNNLPNTTWPGLGNQDGFPDFEAVSNRLGQPLGAQDLVTLLDPPISRQPAGTSLAVQLRGARTFDNPSVYDRVNDDAFDTRGNLLNPNYACEAYRYSTANSGPNRDLPRVAAEVLTPYVAEERVETIRDPQTGMLPRYLNIRLVMTNNTNVTPAISPSLRGLSLVWRMVPR